MDIGLLRVMPRPTHAARSSQMLQQLPLQGAARLNELNRTGFRGGLLA
jgi:hypothetical protein